MNRRTFLRGASGLGVVSAVAYIQVSEERIASLEDAIADLDKRVSALEGGDRDRPSPNVPSDAGALLVEGMGTTVSEKFDLDAGRYRVDASVEVTSGFDGFAVFLHGPRGSEELLFNEIIDANGTWEGSTVVTVDNSGEHFVEASNTDSAWVLEFEPF